MNSCITFYLSLAFPIIWKPSFDYVWGESTHFVIEDGGDRPLNKEWSLNFNFLFIYFSVTISDDSLSQERNES